MFEIGSYVMYRSEGVCIVSDIRSESFGSVGKSEEYYILTPISDNKSQVFVPVNNQLLTAFMKPLLSVEEMTALVEDCRDKRIEWISDARARNTYLREIIASGDRRNLILLMNTLYHRFEEIRSNGKKISSAEYSIYSKAERLIYEELATTTDIQSQAAVMSVLLGETELHGKL